MITSLLFCLLQGQKQIEDLTARKIVEEMYAAYAGCKSYSDTGTVVCGDSHITFKTFYRKPNKLYVEFNSKDYYTGRHVLWSKGSLVSKDPADIPENRREGAYLETYSWDEGDEKIETGELEMALAGATGISLGGASTVPGILFPNAAYARSYQNMPDFQVMKAEAVHGTLCDVLYSKHWNTRIWIARTSHLLMREDTMLSDRCRIEILPRLNPVIPDSQFLFRPPKAK